MHKNLFVTILLLLLVSSISTNALDNNQVLEPKKISSDEYISQNPTIQRKAIIDFIVSQFDSQSKSIVMCQHFSGQLVTQIFVFFRTPHIPLVINNH